MIRMGSRRRGFEFVRESSWRDSKAGGPKADDPKADDPKADDGLIGNGSKSFRLKRFASTFQSTLFHLEVCCSRVR